MNTRKEKAADVKDDSAAVPATLGGRTLIKSMSVHKPSNGLRDGGERKITKIDE